jgi:predicted Zn-dependent protease
MSNKIRCVGKISHYADPEKFHKVLGELDDTKPNCPWNVDAAETLAKPPERRGWQQTYVDAVENWEEQS